MKSEIENSFNFSQSSLQDYSDCPRRFFLRYIEKLKWPAVETSPQLENELHQIEGQKFHRILHQYMLGLPPEKLVRMANSNNLSRWWKNFESESLTSLSSLTNQKLYPEVTLSAPIGNHRIVAKYDLIAVKDGIATIYDWKTYHKRPKNEWILIRLQTKVYRWLLVFAGAHLNGNQPFRSENVEMVYWYADYPSEPSRLPYTASTYKNDWEELIALINEISAKESFPLIDDEKKCGYCTYRSYCERGVKAGEAEEVESEITNSDITMEQIQEIEF